MTISNHKEGFQALEQAAGRVSITRGPEEQRSNINCCGFLNVLRGLGKWVKLRTEMSVCVEISRVGGL